MVIYRLGDVVIVLMVDREFSARCLSRLLEKRVGRRLVVDG